jgi:small subunit ribosomal protein S29
MRSNYRTPHFDHLESYALSLPRLLLGYVSGRKSFDKGAILTSISLSTAQHAPPKEIYAAVPELSKAPVVTPYDKLDEHHVEAARGLEVFDVGDRLDLQEARGILDLCQQRKFVFGGESRSLLRCVAISQLITRAPAFSNGRNFVGQVCRIRRQRQRVCTGTAVNFDSIKRRVSIESVCETTCMN